MLPLLTQTLISFMRNSIFLSIAMCGITLFSTSCTRGNSQSIRQTNLDVNYDSLINSQQGLAPAIMVKLNPKSDSKPLDLTDLKVSATVVGNIASTTFEMTFTNTTNRILEGQLYFPLGDGKTITNFEMGVDGVMRKGVIIEKEKGRVVFEKIVRKNIDPGLIEWTKGNNFKARVYPIPANGVKKISITYQQELISSPKESIYILPLAFQQTVNSFELNVEVLKQQIKPNLLNNELVNFEFESWNDQYKASRSYKNYIPSKTLAISLPQKINTRPIYTETLNGEHFFHLNLHPQIEKKPKQMANEIGLLWDVSHSSKNRNLEKEINILKDYFNQVNNCTVELITFSNTVHEHKKFMIRNAQSDELIAYIKTLDYDGGTQFGAINLKDYNSNEYLLFSDGLTNFGASDILTNQNIIHTITTNPTSDFSHLKYLAKTTGGQYINAIQLTAQQINDRWVLQPYRLINVTFNDEIIREVYPESALITSNGLQLAGKFNGTKATLTLNYGFGNTVSNSETITINTENAIASKGLIKNIWAQKKLAHLDVFHQKFEKEITHLGKTYGLVTRFTSLIILDRLEDYIEHEITPPVEWQKEYFNAIAKTKLDQEKQESAHMKAVKQLFKDQVWWWNQIFEIPEKIKHKPEHKMALDSTSLEMYNIISLTNQDELTIQEDNLIEGDAPADYSFTQSSESNRAEEVQEEEITSNVEAGNVGLDINNKLKDKRPKGKITVTPWQSDAEYLKTLESKSKTELWSTYLSIKPDYESSPAFYMDVAEYFSSHLNSKTALRVLSNLAELELEDHQSLRILAYRLIDLEAYDLAILTLKEVLKIRKEEPQSYRDLGLACAKNQDYQTAIEYLYEVVIQSWDSRFPAIELIALNEMNAIIAQHSTAVNTDFIDQELIKNLPIDIRIVLNWDTDNCDIDLWVTDPLGEKCFYSHNRTIAGGNMSNDFTGGYGPEVFLLKKAIPGKYKIEANYYGTGSQKMLAPVTLKMSFFTQYGLQTQKVKTVTLRLDEAKEVVQVAEITF